MKRQSKSYWCGVASIANALEVLGIRRSQREIARLCHVSPEAGTDETEMKRALLANGVWIDEWAGDDFGHTWNWLVSQLTNAGPAILCVDNDEHWITAIGLCDNRAVLFDPSRNFGVEVLHWSELCKRWKNEDGFYALGVSLVR